MQSVVILRALELSASKVSLSRLVFWWLTCIPVLFFILFILFFFFFFLFLFYLLLIQQLLHFILFYLLIQFFFLVLYLDFFECFSIPIFSYWVHLFILYLCTISILYFLAFKVCLHSRLSFVQLHLRLFCFSAMQSHNLHTVTLVVQCF